MQSIPKHSRPAYLVVLRRGLPAPCSAGKLIPLVLTGMPGIPPTSLAPLSSGRAPASCLTPFALSPCCYPVPLK